MSRWIYMAIVAAAIGALAIPALAYLLPDIAPEWTQEAPPEERWIARFKAAPRRAAISELARMPKSAGGGLARIAVAPVLDHVASQQVGKDVIVGVVVVST